MWGWGRDRGYVQLRDSIERGDRQNSKNLLQRGARVNSCNPVTQTPLHYAVEQDDIEIVQLLLTRNARTNAVNNRGQTPLHIAVSKRNVDICNLLVQNGASVVLNSDQGITPLSHAIKIKNVRIVETLIEKAPTSCTDFKICCYHLKLAIDRGLLEIVQMILNKNPNVNHKDEKTGRSSLHFALMKCNLGIVSKLLEHGAEVNEQDNDGKMSLHLAVECQFNEHTIDVVELLLQYGANSNIPDKQGKLPIHIAAECGNYQIIEYLLQHGSTVDPVVTETAPDERKRGFTPLFFGILKKSITTVSVLLRSGANVNAKASNGNTVLYSAVQTKQDDIVKEILKYNPDVHDERNKESLVLAISLEDWQSKVKRIVESLVQYGFTINSEMQHISLLFHAVKKDYVQIVDQLIKAGADIHEELNGKCVLEVTLDGKLINMAKLLIEHGALVKNELLKKAVENCKADFVDLFLQNGADPNLADENEISILNICISRYGEYNIEARDYNMAKLLIEHGARVERFELLKKAVENCKADFVDLFLQHGADPNLADENGISILNICISMHGKYSIEVKEDYTYKTIYNKENYDLEYYDRQRREYDDYSDFDDYDHEHYARLRANRESRHNHEQKVKIFQIIHNIIKNGANVNIQDQLGKTLIHAAVENEDLEMIEYLIQKGSNINIPDKHGKMPLHIAVEKSQYKIIENKVKIIECIIKNGGLVDATVLVQQLDFQESHFTPLLFAIEVKCLPSVKVLLSSGASVNFNVNSNGRTVLFTAVQTNKFEIVKEVLKYKPGITEFDNKQSLPLAVSGNGEISRLIVNSLLDYGLVVDATFVHDVNIIFEAITNGHVSMVGQLLERGANVNSKDSNDNSILYRAVEQDNLKMVEEILKYKPDVNEKSSIESFTIAVSRDGDQSKWIVETLLEYGFSINSERVQDKTFIFNAVKKNHVSMVSHLLNRGMDVNIKDNLGYSILYTAVRHENLNMVQEILKHKPDIQDKCNIKSLRMGVSAHAKRSQLIVENLLEYGFPITSENKQSEKFVLDTIRNHHLKVMDLLIKSGANVNAEIQGKCLLEVGFSSTVQNHHHTAMAKLFIKNGAQVKDGFRPIIQNHYHTDMAKLLIENGAQVKNELLKKATEKRKPDFAELFLQHGADPNFADENGETLLHYIANNTHISRHAEMRSIAISLMKFGAKIDTQTKQGNTALHVVCDEKDYSVEGDVEFLCGHGARVDIKNESGKTALHLVIENCDIATVRALVSHGANIHSRDNEGRTPLHIACLLWETKKIRFLIEHGANVDSKDNNGGSAIQVSLRADGRLATTVNRYNLSETDCDTYFDLMLNCSSNNIQDLTKTTELLMSEQQSLNYNLSLRRMRCTLVKHISKLRELGFHGEEDDIQFQKMFKQLTNTIDERELITFVTRCSVEVQIMKVESIGDTKMSYYDFLRKTCHRIALCLKNESLSTGLELSQFRTSFPTYATMIQNQFKQGQMRLNLLKEVNLKRQYLFPELTFDCVQELLQYLDIEDFHTLVRVFPSDRNVSVMENPTSPIATDKEDTLDISKLTLEEFL